MTRITFTKNAVFIADSKLKNEKNKTWVMKVNALLNKENAV